MLTAPGTAEHAPELSVVGHRELGWVTATNPELGLVFGYCWKRADFPWISLWCCERDDGYMSRGIEFGTTGLHKPFPMLAKHPTLFGLPTFLTLDAKESQTRVYAMFLAGAIFD